MIKDKINAFQSDRYLPTVRVILVCAALLMVVGIVIGLASLLVIQVWISAAQPPRQSEPTARISTDFEVDSDRLSRSLSPPLLVSAAPVPITGIFGSGTIVARADFSGNRIARFELGADVARYLEASEVVADDVEADVSSWFLRASPSLVSLTLRSRSERTELDVTFNVIDIFGNVGGPFSVNVPIQAQPPLEPREERPLTPEAVPVRPASGQSQENPIQSLAQTIAAHFHPDRGVEYFSTYALALRLPTDCSQARPIPVSIYAEIFEAFLAASQNQQVFGTFRFHACRLWLERLEIIDQEQSDQEGEARRLDAEYAAATLRHNASIVSAHASRVMVSLWLLGLIGLLIILAFPICLLAIERHARSIEKLLVERKSN